MSYYTQYRLTTEPQGSVTQEEVITALLENVDRLKPGDPGHSARTLHWKALMESDWTDWENHERDLALISTQWPKTLFTLSGDEEDRDNRWLIYCRNGLTQRVYADPAYPPMDPDQFTRP